MEAHRPGHPRARGSVAAIELGDGLIISFTNDDLWDLEVPRPGRKNAETVVGLLGA